MTTETSKKESAEAKEKNKEVTFKCKYCGQQKPVSEMRMITRFFPVLIACRDCEKKLG
jgi:transcription elongation factor Elf1